MGTFLKDSINKAPLAEENEARRKIVALEQENAAQKEEIAALKQKVADYEAANHEVTGKLIPRSEIGKLIGDKGIFMGTCEPRDESGGALGKTYNVFAAPEDLSPEFDFRKKTLRTFNESMIELTSRKNWCGHDGEPYESEGKLYLALKNGDYKGGWFIPPLVFVAVRFTGRKHRPENLYDLKDTGDFKGTLTDNTSNNAIYYQTCTGQDGKVSYVSLSSGNCWSLDKDEHRMSCRPCRVELVL